MNNEQFAAFKLENGVIMYINKQYITAYVYLKDDDKTAVTVLGESKYLYFPGDQTHEIEKATIRKEGR